VARPADKVVMIWDVMPLRTWRGCLPGRLCCTPQGSPGRNSRTEWTLTPLWQQASWRRFDGQAIEVLVSSELTEDTGGLLILTTVVGAPEEG